MDERERLWEARFAVPVMIAAIATIPLLVIERNNPHGAGHTVALIANWVIWFAFASEALVLFATAGSKARWLRAHPIEVVVVFLTPPFLSVAIQQVRLLRLARLLRLGPLLFAARAMFSLDGLRYAVLIAFLVLIGGAEAFASAEHVSVGQGLYMSITTMTTLGFVQPVTDTGKVVASILAPVGLAFFAMITGAVAERFLSPDMLEVEEEVEGSEAMLLREIREIGERLRQLELLVQRRARGS